jgi:hypothetical protein
MWYNEAESSHGGGFLWLELLKLGAAGQQSV